MSTKKKSASTSSTVSEGGRTVKMTATVTNVNRVGDPESTNQDVELNVKAGATDEATIAAALEQLKEKANAIPAGCHCYNIRVFDSKGNVIMNRSPKFNNEDGDPEKGTLDEALDFLIAEAKKPKKKAKKVE